MCEPWRTARRRSSPGVRPAASTGSAWGSLPTAGLADLASARLAGLDAQLVIRPLMEKVQRKGYEAALRKFTFPHVSAALSEAGGQGRPARSPPCPATSPPCPTASGGSCCGAGGSWEARLAGPAGSPAPGSHPTGPSVCPSPPLWCRWHLGAVRLRPSWASRHSACFLLAATPCLLRQESPAAPLPVLPAPGALEARLHRGDR